MIPSNNVHGRMNYGCTYHDRSLRHKQNCPVCGKTAASIQDIDKFFGFRNMSGFIRSQSWCRDCRKNSNLIELLIFWQDIDRLVIYFLQL